MAAATSIAAAMMKPNMMAIFLAMSLDAVLHVDAILYFFGRSVVVERQMSNVSISRFAFRWSGNDKIDENS